MMRHIHCMDAIIMLWMRILTTDHGTSTGYTPGIREFHPPVLTYLLSYQISTVTRCEAHNYELMFLQIKLYFVYNIQIVPFIFIVTIVFVYIYIDPSIPL